MNWKWLIGGLGVAGALAWLSKASDRTVVVDSPNAPNAPSAPRTSTTVAEEPLPAPPTGTSPWAFKTFTVEVTLRANFLEKPIALQQVRDGGVNLARQLAGQLVTHCPGHIMPFANGPAPRSVTASIVDDGVKLVAVWPKVVWEGSTPEFAQCIMNLLRGLENGDRVIQVVLR